MKLCPAILIALSLVLSFSLMAGCEEEEETKATKTTQEKLDSDDPAERQEGLDEAEARYGDER